MNTVNWNTQGQALGPVWIPVRSTCLPADWLWLRHHTPLNLGLLICMVWAFHWTHRRPTIDNLKEGGLQSRVCCFCSFGLAMGRAHGRESYSPDISQGAERKERKSPGTRVTLPSHTSMILFFFFMNFSHELINGLVKSDPSMQSSSRTNLQTCFNTESYVLNKVIRSRLYLTLREQWTYAGDSVEVVRTL